MSIFDVKIETDRLILRRLKRSDVNDMYEYTSDPDVSKHLSWEPHTSIIKTEEYIESVIKQYNSDSSYSWAIELVEKKRFIGIVRIFDVSMSNKRGELSYILNPKFQGRGIITEALSKVITFCFEVLKFNRLQARCTVENVSSEKVMQKLGMKYEGTLEEYWINKGNPTDAKLYAIISRYFNNK